MLTPRTAFALSWICACRGSAPHEPNEPAPTAIIESARAPSASMSNPPPKHTPKRDDQTSAPLYPASTLLAWLQQDAGDEKRTMFRVPVVVRFADQARLGLGDVAIAAQEADLTPDSLALDVDDGALGISLLDRLRSSCPPNRQACAVWLEGHWGRLVEVPSPAPASGSVRRWPFAVRRVGELVDPAAGEVRATRLAGH
jgi:hypothetical protein